MNLHLPSFMRLRENPNILFFKAQSTDEESTEHWMNNKQHEKQTLETPQKGSHIILKVKDFPLSKKCNQVCSFSLGQKTSTIQA